MKHKVVDRACHVFQARTKLKQRSRTAQNVQPTPTRPKQSKRPAQTALLTSTPIQAKRFVKNVKREKKFLAVSVDLFTAFNANPVKKIQYQVSHARTAVPGPTITQITLDVMVVSLESGAMLKD